MRTDIINNWRVSHGLEPLAAPQAVQLAILQNRLLTVNQYLNLTAITTEADIAVKHFIDSMTLLPWIPHGANVIDVGTGAGFPGLVIKILRPDIQITLVDALRKRIHFLQETIGLMQLTGVLCIHARAEALSKTPQHRASYPICTARAVAKLGKLAGYTLPFLHNGGRLLAMKGPDITDELKNAKKFLNKFNGILIEAVKVEIAAGIVHTVAVIEKGQAL